jgi:pimeloyl-ACP methyl ester carboxylesterase
MKPLSSVLVAAALLLLPQAGLAADSDCQPADLINYVTGEDECLAIETFATAGARTLVIVLHGDLSRGGGADYIFQIAEGAQAMGATGVAMMRLGYSGGGKRSTGQASRDESRDSIYTADEMDAIADAARRLKAHHGAEEVVMIGHSGGAVMTGVILGRHPGLVQRALLLSCPCDVPTWRRIRGRKPFARAESPHEYIDDIPAGTLIRLVVGSGDSNTVPRLSRDYAEDAQARGLDATTTVVDGARHNFNGAMRDSDGWKAAFAEVVGAN